MTRSSASSLPATRRRRARDRRAAICRRYPARQCAARQARVIGVRARPHRRDRIVTKPRACLVCAASSPRAICRSPFPRYGPVYADRPMLAVGETKFSGEPVAVVVGRHEDAAGHGARARSHRSSRNCRQCCRSTRRSTRTHRSCRTPRCGRTIRWRAPTRCSSGSSVGATSTDAPADLVIENDYAFPMVTHFAIEPHAFLAAPDANGVTVWSPTQHPYVLQRVVAAALQWPIARVRDHCTRSRRRVRRQGLAEGRAADGVAGAPPRTAGAPRADARRNISGRPARVGAHSCANGFRQRRPHRLSGHPRELSAGRVRRHRTRVVVSKASYSACGPYRAAHARIIARALLSHTTPSTAFRGFGTPQASWAVESQLNEAAAALGIDPVEIRRRNLPAKGEAFNPNDTPADGDWNDALTKAAAAIGWNAPLAPQSRPRHLARPEELFHRVAIRGDRATALRRQRVRAVRHLRHGPGRAHGDDADCRAGARPCARSHRDCDGRYVRRAVRLVHVREPIDRVHGQRHHRRVRQRQEAAAARSPRPYRGTQDDSLRSLLKAHFGPPRGELIGIGEAGNAYEPGHPLGGRAAFWELMCAACEVEVDPDTGETTIRKLVLVSDVGKALNPHQVEGAGRRRRRDGARTYADGAARPRR